jgi:hypothetical protein
LTLENRKGTSFLKKRSKKLLLLWATGAGAITDHNPVTTSWPGLTRPSTPLALVHFLLKKNIKK